MEFSKAAEIFSFIFLNDFYIKILVFCVLIRVWTGSLNIFKYFVRIIFVILIIIIMQLLYVLLLIEGCTVFLSLFDHLTMTSGYQLSFRSFNASLHLINFLLWKFTSNIAQDVHTALHV